MSQINPNHKTVTIPTTSNPYRVIVNGVEFKFEAGATVEVPPEVAAAINTSVNAAADLVKPGEVQPPFGASWNDLTDKPFGEIGGDTITWDGDTTGLQTINGIYFKVSDALVARADLAQGYTITIYDSDKGATETIQLSDDAFVAEENGAGYALYAADPASGAFPIVILAGEGTPYDSGVYFLKGNAAGLKQRVTSLTIPGFTGFPTVKKIDEKYLPNTSGGGIKTAIIKQVGYDNALAGLQTTESAEAVYFTCTNMTFEEAYATIMKGEPLSAMIMFLSGTLMMAYADYVMLATPFTGFPCIYIESDGGAINWTADGLSTEVI